jgi:hypothetical protein
MNISSYMIYKTAEGVENTEIISFASYRRVC